MVLASGPVAVRADGAPEQDSLERVIRAQLQAFSRDDDEEAFSFASPAIQRGFSSPRAFGDMVRERYPEVYNATTVRFREQVPHPGFVVQRVQLRDPNGLYWDAYYRMERRDGGWCIGGVVLERVAGGI
ncbi:DUF4864 domain-containing protein [Marinobacter halodurans]|uniref:DUF4864 domain-containing protein n=2 Tax=Marinobacter halodurans TaxID=2528979 RepID=A0ABY1ZGD9_9GAMM|nr:DUF4864 domain-containing protein [Marinobacter halodurans]